MCRPKGHCQCLSAVSQRESEKEDTVKGLKDIKINLSSVLKIKKYFFVYPDKKIHVSKGLRTWPSFRATI